MKYAFLCFLMQFANDADYLDASVTADSIKFFLYFIF